MKWTNNELILVQILSWAWLNFESELHYELYENQIHSIL